MATLFNTGRSAAPVTLAGGQGVSIPGKGSIPVTLADLGGEDVQRQIASGLLRVKYDPPADAPQEISVGVDHVVQVVPETPPAPIPVVDVPVTPSPDPDPEPSEETTDA